MRRIYSGLLLFCLMTAPVAAQTNADAEALATRAHQALLLQRYPEAASAFAEEEAMLRQGQLAGIDAAIYWQAFVALKLRRQEDVQRQVGRLLKEFPDSVWADDARALLPDQSSLLRLLKPLGSSRHANERDDRSKDTADMLIKTILSLDQEAAVSRLTDLIKDPQTDDLLASRALYALNVIAATNALVVAQNVLERPGSRAKVERQAIALLAASNDDGIQSSLNQRYGSYPASARAQLLNAWATAGQLASVRAALAKEQDASVRWQGINALGVLRDQASLIALVQTPRAESDRLVAINGLAIMEQGDTLISFLDDPKLAADRLAIIRSLGTAGGLNTPARLVQEFANPDLKQRQAVADSLAALNAGAALLDLLKHESDRASRVLLMTAIRRIHDPVLLSQAEAHVNEHQP